MGTRAHWFDSRYYAVTVDEDGDKGRPVYGDTITNLVSEAFADDPHAFEVEVWRQHKRKDRPAELVGRYIFGEAGITKVGP